MEASVARRHALLCGLLFALWAAGSAAAGPCDLLGGDADGDGICDDGNGDGIAGNAPCSCQPGSPASCAANCDDNCPWTANPDQLDVGAVGVPDVPDHIGDACQCLDVSNDGHGNVLDAVLYRRAVTTHPPPLPAPQKCLGAGAATCDASDVTPLRNALAGASPPPANVCAAAGACTASADCPAGIACNLAEQRCENNDGQACVQGSQCLDGSCCSDRCTTVATDAANCGACGVACTNPHGGTSCASGTCAPTCAAGFSDCNGNRRDGCETALNTNTNCGACGVPCARLNATATCSTGTCTISSCNFGYADCDGNMGNGCEVNHTLNGGTLALGTFAADVTGCGVVASHSGVAVNSATVTFLESNGTGACAPTSGLVELVVPPGLDWDLTVTAPAQVTCTHWNGSAYVAGCSGTNGTGQVERIRLVSPETACFLGLGDTTDQTFTATVQIQFFGGGGCGSWQLNVSAGSGC
jgi:hypothetical protein